MTAPRRTYAKATSAAKMIDVLGLIAEGYTNARIARSLHLSEDTVKGRVGALLVDLNATDRAHAVAKGYQGGYFGLIGEHESTCSLRRPTVCSCDEAPADRLFAALQALGWTPPEVSR